MTHIIPPAGKDVHHHPHPSCTEGCLQHQELIVIEDKTKNYQAALNLIKRSQSFEVSLQVIQLGNKTQAPCPEENSRRLVLTLQGLLADWAGL